MEVQLSISLYSMSSVRVRVHLRIQCHVCSRLSVRLKKGLQAQGARIPNLLSSIDWTTSPLVSLPCTPGSLSKVSSHPTTPNPVSAKSRVLERNSWHAAGIHRFCTVALGPSERAPTWGHPHFSYGEAFPAKRSTQPHLQLYPKCKIYKIFFGRSKRCQVRAKQSAKLIPRKYRIWQHGSSSWVWLDAAPRRCSNASLRIIFCQANTGTEVFSSAERDMRLALRMKVFTAKMRWWG
jgi:hypothetical protein